MLYEVITASATSTTLNFLKKFGTKKTGETPSPAASKEEEVLTSGTSKTMVMLKSLMPKKERNTAYIEAELSASSKPKAPVKAELISARTAKDRAAALPEDEKKELTTKGLAQFGIGIPARLASMQRAREAREEERKAMEKWVADKATKTAPSSILPSFLSNREVDYEAVKEKFPEAVEKYEKEYLA